MKLAMAIKAAIDLNIDILGIQEVRRTYSGIFEDVSLKEWQWDWSGNKRKHEHGVGILLAAHVTLDAYQEHHPARIISATICVKNMILSILNVYAPTYVTESESLKNTFHSALNKAKEQLDGNPSHKVVVRGDFNATIF